jgi:hypothetical protein
VCSSDLNWLAPVFIKICAAAPRMVQQNTSITLRRAAPAVSLCGMGLVAIVLTKKCASAYSQNRIAGIPIE